MGNSFGSGGTSSGVRGTLDEQPEPERLNLRSHYRVERPEVMTHLDTGDRASSHG